MKKITWGVIGSGGIARRRTIPEGIIPADNAELKIVYDVNPKSNQEVAAEFSAKPAASLNELLSSDVDAVYIATPANLHFEQVCAAAKAGKHVLCEKPLGMSVKETEKMISVCQKAGVTFGTAFLMRFSAQHLEAARLVGEGKLGKPVYGRAQLSCWYPPMQGAWRQNPKIGGGGSLIDMGGHCIDLLEMFFGPVKRVACFTGNTVHDYQTEDSAVVMISFASGATATVDTFFCIPDQSSKNRLELYGSKGSILAEGTIGQSPAGDMHAFFEAGSGVYDATQSRGDDKGVLIQPTPKNTYRAEIEEFSQAILEKREPSCSAEIGLTSQKILAACYRSAKTGKAEKI
ncbi:MAG: Gfo/Idh/MocA family oxidoreductase [Spirochaetia bacterium]|nr:Gfo/Idh/MocA family oxidoreductase [Spirochaetia bacterium]